MLWQRKVAHATPATPILNAVTKSISTPMLDTDEKAKKMNGGFQFAVFSCAASLLFRLGAHVTTILFFIGGLLFMVSDFIMIYYSFGKKVRPLRAINLITYYIAQLLIALTILFF